MTRRDCVLLLASALPARSAGDLLADWRAAAAGVDGVVGAAAMNLPSGELVSLHGGDHFPLASVCKLPIAMHILAMVDEGKLNLQSMIEVLPQDVSLDVSEVGHRWPKQKRFSAGELISLMVAASDNTAVETLYRVGGGAQAIMARLRAWQIQGIRIDRTEKQCTRDAARDMRAFIADPRDSGTPAGTVHLLARLFRGELLSTRSTAHLIGIMETTRTGPGRLKGLLPGIVVAHKTGTTGTHDGLNGGTNDVGILAGKLAIAVYVKGSTRELAAREHVIASMARAAFQA